MNFLKGMKADAVIDIKEFKFCLFNETFPLVDDIKYGA